jgi:fumarate reductase subunit D
MNIGGFNAEIKEHKQLRILSYAYSQIILIVLILCGFLIPLLIFSIDMITSSNKMIDIQNYLFGKLLGTSVSVVNIKCKMSRCDTSSSSSSELEYHYHNTSHIQSIIQAINIFPQLDAYYNNKFLVNACASAFDYKDNATLYNTCMSDPIITSANNTDSLLKLIAEKILTLTEKDKLKTATDSNYTITQLYKENAFVDLESIFYNYITPVSTKVETVMVSSLEMFLTVKLWLLIVLCGCLVLCMIIMAIWIGICVVNQLIHLLGVSRCILKIIPTIVIYNTPELESWIENKY